MISRAFSTGSNCIGEIAATQQGAAVGFYTLLRFCVKSSNVLDLSRQPFDTTDRWFCTS